MRHLVGLFLLLGLSCGTLVETLEEGDGASGQDGGLICAAADDPCACTPCASSSECAPGLGLNCVPARRHSTNCPDSRFVCSTTK